MSDDPLFHPLPPIDAETWRQRVAGDVGGDLTALHTPLDDGITVSPLYTANRGTQDQRPPVARERGWRVAQLYEQRDPEAARAALLRDLGLDLGVAWLRLNLSGRGAGIEIAEYGDLDRLLAGIDWSNRGLIVDGGPDGLAAAATLARWCSDAAQRPRSVALAIDPLGTLALEGVLPGSLDNAWRQLRTVTAGADPSWWTAGVSTVAYHNGGASPVQELAFAMATGVEVLRQLTVDGTPVDAAAARLYFTFALGRDFFTEIAKLRAARWLWAKVVRASGVADALPRMRIVACTSTITQSRRAPLMNQLRITTEAFSAAVGGADDIVVTPFDRLVDARDPLGGRVAINTQHVLAEEANLSRVADPAGGSGYVEDLTKQLARGAWQAFRAIEAEGGMTACLRGGGVADRVAARASKHRVAVAHRRDPLVGVSAFALLDEPAVSTGARRVETSKPRSQPNAEAAGQLVEADWAAVTGAVSRWDAASLASAVAEGVMARVRKIDPVRWAAPFELLHDAADRATAARGQRPACLLVRLGSPGLHQPQAGFVRRALAVGGLRTIEPPPAVTRADDRSAEALAAWANSVVEQARADAIQSLDTVPPVVVCPGDLDPEVDLPAVLDAIRALEPARIVVAGPAPADEGAVDDRLRDGANVLAILARLHVALEITP